MDQVSQNTDIIHYLIVAITAMGAVVTALCGAVVAQWFSEKKIRQQQLEQTKDFVRCTEQMIAVAAQTKETIKDFNDTLTHIFTDQMIPPKRNRR